MIVNLVIETQDPSVKAAEKQLRDEILRAFDFYIREMPLCSKYLDSIRHSLDVKVVWEK